MSIGRVGAARTLNQLIRLPQEELYQACKAGFAHAVAAVTKQGKNVRFPIGVLAFHPVLFHQVQQTFACPYLAEDVKAICREYGAHIDTVLSIHDDIFDTHVQLLAKGQLYASAKKRDVPGSQEAKRRYPLADILEQMQLLGWRATELTFVKNFSLGIGARHILFHAKGHLQSVANIVIQRQTGVYLSHPIAQPRRDMTASTSTEEPSASLFERGKQLQDDIQNIAFHLRKVVPLVEPTAIDEHRLDFGWLKGKTEKDLRTGILPPLFPRWPIADGDHLLPRSAHGAQSPLVSAPAKAFDTHEFSDKGLEDLAVGVELLQEEIVRQVTARDYTLAEQCDLIVAYRPFTKPNSPQPSGGVIKEIGVVLRKVKESVSMCKPALIVYHPLGDERNRRKLEFTAAWPSILKKLEPMREDQLMALHNDFLGALQEMPYPARNEDIESLRVTLGTLLSSSNARVKANLDSSAMASAEQGQRIDATEALLTDFIDSRTIVRSQLHQMVSTAQDGGEYVCFVTSFSPTQAQELVSKSHATYPKFLGADSNASKTHPARRTSNTAGPRARSSVDKGQRRTVGRRVGKS